MVKTTFQAITMVIMYTPDTMLRKLAYDAFKRVGDVYLLGSCSCNSKRNLAFPKPCFVLVLDHVLSKALGENTFASTNYFSFCNLHPKLSDFYTLHPSLVSHIVQS